MRFIKLSGAIFAGALFLTSCNLLETNETAQTNPYPGEIVQTDAVMEADVDYARENLDLQVIGPLLQRAKNAEEFEYLLNSDNRINNLDLNQDGYADYISVAEFEDRNDGERGLSLFSRFGPDLIQEIATIIFDRDGFDSRGARVLLDGNDQLYGDNYYYEANWLDRALPIVSWLFTDRDSNYESPYYYSNYPDYYQAYEVVETPVYLTRVREVYTEPVFTYTTDPTIDQIQISSPYEGRTVMNVYPKPVKQGKTWARGRGNGQGPPEVVPVRNGWIKNGAPKSDKDPKEDPNDFERPRNNKAEKRINKAAEKFEKRENPNNGRRDAPKPVKVDRPNVNQPKPQKVDKPNSKPNKPAKVDNPGRGKSEGNNPGKGGGNGGGKGNNGGGKGGGKKP